MTETIKQIIQELAKEPFKKKFTVISFDALKPDVLLQILNDVLSEIEPSNAMDLREEEPEDTVLRMLQMLRILKYKPPGNDPSMLRIGIMDGDPDVIHSILAWLLPRINELKTRAYLARFLVKIEVPEEIRSDIDVEELYQQYEGLIEQFKVTHKQLETMKAKGFTTSEIRKDIQAMESEQESVQRKTEKLKQKTEGTPNLEATLEVIQNYRKEREHGKELSDQSVSQTQTLTMAEQRIQRLQRQLKEIRQAGIGATPEGILRRMEEDTSVAKFITSEKLPKEIQAERKQLEIFARVMDESHDEHDLVDRKAEIEILKAEVNEMVMKRMMKTEDDKLVMFRQQTAIVANKKLSLIEKIGETRSDLATLKEEIEEKRTNLQKLQGNVTMNEEEFKEYVKNLRVKSTRYKQMKAHLAYLKSESGILAKTVFLLEQDVKNVELNLSATEARLGIEGFSMVQDNLEKVSGEKSNLDDLKSKNLQEMSMAVQELHDKISAKKIDLAPIVKNLNQKRQQSQITTHDYESRKRNYDGIVASVESGLSRIVKEVEQLRKKYEEDQLKYCMLKAETIKSSVDLQRMQDELKLYTAAGKPNTTDAGKKSFKEILVAKVGEQERLGKTLKDEEKEMQVKQLERIRQAQLWKDVVKMLESKLGVTKNLESARRT